MKTYLTGLLLASSCSAPYYTISNRDLDKARRPVNTSNVDVIIRGTRIHDQKAVDLRYEEIKDSIRPVDKFSSEVMTRSRSLRRTGTGLLIYGGISTLLGIAVLAGDVATSFRSDSDLPLGGFIFGAPAIGAGVFAGLLPGAICLGIGLRPAAEYRP